MNSIFSRMSVRRYTAQRIDEEKLDIILRAGFCAPSAANRQPWEFLVVDDEAALKDMAEFTRYSGPLASAPLGMVVCADTKRAINTAFSQQDCAAATQNMLVEAKELGIGSVWIGVYPHKDIVKKLSAYFSLPENIVPLWMIAFGYPEHDGQPMDKYRPERIHRNKW